MPSPPNSDQSRGEGRPPTPGGHAAERRREQMLRDLGRADDEHDVRPAADEPAAEDDADSGADSDTHSDADG